MGLFMATVLGGDFRFPARDQRRLGTPSDSAAAGRVAPAVCGGNSHHGARPGRRVRAPGLQEGVSWRV